MSRFREVYKAICTQANYDAVLISHKPEDSDFCEFVARPLRVLFPYFYASQTLDFGVGSSELEAIEDLARQLGVRVGEMEVSHA